MMHPGLYAATAPTSSAAIMCGSGETLTYGQLEARSNQLAHLWRKQGLAVGDSVALVMENRLEVFIVVWAAQRSGLYLTAINWHLTESEAEYVLRDCGAKAIVASPTTVHLVPDDLCPSLRLIVGGVAEGWSDFERSLAKHPMTPVEHETEGDILLYSSGTTGKPKGIRRPLSGAAFGDSADVLRPLLQGVFGFTSGDVYLSPGPLYHASPLGYSMAIQRLGGCVVVMERFDAEAALAAVQRYHVTHSQWVPTMFVRMLKLDRAVRESFDLSSQRVAIHAAAPCPVEVKHQMIEWWGPILIEFYAMTEALGITLITSAEWLQRPGSVGRAAFGKLHIVGADGAELGPGEIGDVCFTGGRSFEYLGDSEKTAAAFDSEGRGTVGDVGYVDSDGYLFLTDRRANMIISGGVNIYPQEIEDLLIGHPGVMDAAVVGLPDDEMGEKVTAFIQRNPAGGMPTETELISFCKQTLASYKCPRDVRFVDVLPRIPSGKLLKRLLS